MTEKIDVSSQSERREVVIDSFRARARREKQLGAAALGLILLISFAVTWWFLYLAMNISTEYTDRTSAIIGVVGTAILRLGSVAVSLYIISILYNFSKNRFRLHDVLNSRAEILMLYSGDFDNLELLVKTMSIDQIDFGKEPLSMHEKALDVAREAVKKIPTNIMK